MQQQFSVFVEQAAKQIAKLFNQVFPFADAVQFRLPAGVFLAKKGTERNFVIAEKPIDGSIQSKRQLFQRFNRRKSVTIFETRDKAKGNSGALGKVRLGQILFCPANR